MLFSPIIFSIMLFSFRKVRGVLCSNQCDFPNKLTILSDPTELLCMLIRQVNGITSQNCFPMVVHSNKLICPYFSNATYTLSNMKCSTLIIQFLYFPVLYSYLKRKDSFPSAYNHDDEIKSHRKETNPRY